MTHQESAKSKWPFNLVGGILIGLVIGFILGLIEGDLLEGLGFGLIVGLAFGAVFERRHHLMQYPPGVIRRMIIAGGIFLVTLTASLELRVLADSRWLQIALALAPALGCVLVVLAIASALASLDELQRRIQTEAIALGFGFTAITVTTVGLLEEIGFTQPSWIYVVFPMTIGWGLGKLWTMWKYR
jgi:hypothetical protein